VLKQVGRLAEMIEAPLPNIKKKKELWKQPVRQGPIYPT
jgi:hypothetical protein